MVLVAVILGALLDLAFALGPPSCVISSAGEIQVAYSPDGKHIASSADAGDISIWDVATCKLLRTLKAHGKYANSAPAYSPDGKHLASGSEGGAVKIWDVATGSCCTHSRAKIPRRAWLTAQMARTSHLALGSWT